MIQFTYNLLQQLFPDAPVIHLLLRFIEETCDGKPTDIGAQTDASCAALKVAEVASTSEDRLPRQLARFSDFRLDFGELCILGSKHATKLKPNKSSKQASKLAPIKKSEKPIWSQDRISRFFKSDLGSFEALGNESSAQLA